MQKWFRLKCSHNLLSILKMLNAHCALHCLYTTPGNGRKMFILLFAVVHYGQLLVSSSVFSSLTRRGVDGLMFAC